MGSLIEAGADNRIARLERELDFDDLTDDFEDEAPAPEKKKEKDSRLSFLSPGQCVNAPSRGYVWKGMLAPGDIGCIFGAPGAGKSLIVPYVGYAIARGEYAFGQRTKQGGVFYVAAEDPHGMRGRVTALQMQHGDADEFLLVEGVSNLLVKESPDLLALRKAVAARKPALIVLDTLAMSFPGLEENSAEAMGRVVAVARALTKHGAAVVLIHHDTKAEGSTPRGHSLLNGALDMAMHVSRDENGIVRGKLTKNRNGSCDRDIAFKIGTVEVGEDEDGDAISFAYADELAAGSAPKTVKLTTPQKEALTILRDMMATGGDMSSGVALEEWRQACSISPKVCASDNRKSVVTAVRRALEGLFRSGHVFRHGENVMLDDPLIASDDEFDDLEANDDLV